MTPDAILLLEDDADRLARFRAVAAAAFPGLRLVTWASARVMVAELGRHLPAARVVGLDHDLEPAAGDPADPGDGLDVARWLAARPPACPVVIHDWIEVDWRLAVRRAIRRR